MYALFCQSCYYPSGGWKDYVGTYGTIDEAVERAQQWEAEEFTWGHEPWYSAHFHVVDLTTGSIVKDSVDD